MATIDLIVLGILKKEPMGAYDIQKLVEYRNISKWVKISTPSIYKKAIQLEEKGFIKGEIVKEGKMPEKAVYSLTDEGEKEFVGRGVSYCAVCDGAFYKDKVVAVVGGGNAAVEEACYLTKFASKVYLIHRRDELRADKIVQERAFKNEKLEFIYDTIVNKINGENLVKYATIENVKTHEIKDLAIDGIFPYIGFEPNADLFTGQIKQDKNGFIIVDEAMQTSVKGVYAIGDVRVTPLRQVITAAADGAIAAVYAGRYIETLETVSV